MSCNGNCRQGRNCTCAEEREDGWQLMIDVAVIVLSVLVGSLALAFAGVMLCSVLRLL